MILIDSSIDIYGVIFSNLDFFDISKQRTEQMEELGDQYDIFVHLFLTQLTKRIKMFNADKNNRIVLAIDSRSWRKDYFEKVKDDYFKNYYKNKEKSDEGYKAHREKSDAIDWNKIYKMVDDIVDNLNKYTDIVAIKIEEAEADDIIGALTLNNSNEDVVIVSGDKDFKQLLTKSNIKLYDGRKGQYAEVSDAELFLKIHIIMGDKADEIPAIMERVGEKTAIKLLPNIDMMLETDNDLKFRYKINKKLIDLTEIPSYISDKIINSYDDKKSVFNFNANKFTEFLNKYRCRELLSNVNSFKFSNNSYSEINKEQLKNDIIKNFFDEI